MGGKKHFQSKSEEPENLKKDNWFDVETTTAICSTIWHTYCMETSKKLKIIDAYLLNVLLTGATKFSYALIIGSFPFNAILSGFISCVGSFVLGVSLRLQVNSENKSIFNGVTDERAFADFIFAHIILHLVVINFIG